jgi:transcriptional regulator with XRE-family HTH domain
MARGNFGERLKRERELREVTLEEITSATRIGPRFLDALENEDWDKLPGGVFNRGFVRSIARYLGLDEEAFLAEYDLAHKTQVNEAPSPRPEDRIPSPPRWIPFALILGVLVLLVGLAAAGRYGWRYYRARHSHTPSVPAAPAVPQTATAPVAAAATNPPVPSLDLFVSISAPTHVHIESDGYVVFDSDMQAGESRHFFAIDKFKVSASNSTAVLLRLNGQSMPSLGPPGSSGTMNLSHNDLR